MTKFEKEIFSVEEAVGKFRRMNSEGVPAITLDRQMTTIETHLTKLDKMLRARLKRENKERSSS